MSTSAQLPLPADGHNRRPTLVLAVAGLLAVAVVVAVLLLGAAPVAPATPDRWVPAATDPTVGDPGCHVIRGAC